MLASLEEYGFRKPGEAGDFVEDDGIAVGGNMVPTGALLLLPAPHRLRHLAPSAGSDMSCLPVVRVRVGAGERPGDAALVGRLPSADAAGVE